MCHYRHMCRTTSIVPDPSLRLRSIKVPIDLREFEVTKVL